MTAIRQTWPASAPTVDPLVRRRPAATSPPTTESRLDDIEARLGAVHALCDEVLTALRSLAGRLDR